MPNCSPSLQGWNLVSINSLLAGVWSPGLEKLWLKMVVEAIGERQARFNARVALIAVLAGAAIGVGVAAIGPLYLVAGLIGLAVGIAFLRNTQVGILSFVAIATLLPFAVIPVPLGAFKLTLIDVTLTTLLLVWVVRLLMVPDTRLHVGGVGNLVLLFILLALVSFIGGTAYTISAENIRLFLKMINSILFFFTIVNCLRTKRHVEQVIAGMIIGGSVTAAIGIALYFTPADTATRLLSALRPLGYPSGPDVLRYIAGTDTLRAISTSVDPNILGATLMLSGILSISQLFSPATILPRRVLVATSGTIVAGLLLTLSRSSWIGLIVGVLVITSFRRRRLWILFIALAIVFYAGLLPENMPFVSHLESGLQARDQAAAMRLGEYKDALRLITGYPWFGVGFGQAPSADLYVGVSSIYLLMAEEMGLVGTAVFLLIMGVLLLDAIRRLPRIQDARWQVIALGLVASLLGALTAGVLDHHFFGLAFPHTVALFWMLVGLIAVATRMADREGEP